VVAALGVAGLLKLIAPVAPEGPLGSVRTRLLGVAEISVAAGVAAGSGTARWLAAGMFLAFAGWLGRELRRGRAGAPCPCLGTAGTIGARALARTLALLALALLAALLPAPALSTTGWLALACACTGLAATAAALVGLTLAREVSRLRARQGALEVDSEGPPLGIASPLIERFDEAAALAPVVLAVFVSPGCALCATLAPALAELGAELPIEVFDEQQEPLAWEVAAIPGSPFAVAMDRDGTVLAKGTFNSPVQLRSIPATAIFRGRVPAHA